MGDTLSAGTLYLVFVQIASRGLTFIGNQFLLRFLSPELLGIAVQLELLSVMTLYFSRESLRVALQRQPSRQPSVDTKVVSKTKQDSSHLQSSINLSFIVIAIGSLISPLISISYLKNTSDLISGSPFFIRAFSVYAAATIIELLAEPSFLVIQREGLIRARAASETGAAIARCVASCLTAVIMKRQQQDASVLPFAIGQLSYAVILWSGYRMSTAKTIKNLKVAYTLRKINQDVAGAAIMKLWPKDVALLASTLYLQSVFKFLLTQGDAIILSLIASLPDQGTFALASNYGGLLARLVFQPVEESSRNMFGRLLSTDAKTSTSDRQRSIQQSLDYLGSILHFYLLMSIPIMSLGPYLLPLLVGTLMGRRWQSFDLASVLSGYCYYLPFMAVNGVLDAFVTSVATPIQLRNQSIWMVGFTISYAVSAWGFVRLLDLGATGLVYANILSMFLRMVWSIYFIRGWINATLQNQSSSWTRLRGHFPRLPSVVVALSIMVISRLAYDAQTDQHDLKSLSREQAVFLLTALVCLASTMLIAEHEFLIDTCTAILPQRYATKLQKILKKLNPDTPNSEREARP